ncbi:phage holin family protein [Rhodococcus sp. NPDC058514]|uniref:phage holin family protein n=1 Tax=unclassified Rhodococcus (in: high G+C Gram-positive bacteria) TaxID=192944 RepID=UPI00366695FA
MTTSSSTPAKLWVPRILTALVANGVVLWIADLVLGRFHISYPLWFIVGTILFTLATLFVKPIVAGLLSNVPGLKAYTWVVNLIATYVVLLIVVLLTNDFQIRGFWTWVWATLIIWIGSVVYDEFDDKLESGVQSGLNKATGNKFD